MLCYGGDFAVQRSVLQLHPQTRYAAMARLLGRGDNILEGHMAERTWARMFAEQLRPRCPIWKEAVKEGIQAERCVACEFARCINKTGSFRKDLAVCRAATKGSAEDRVAGSVITRATEKTGLVQGWVDGLPALVTAGSRYAKKSKMSVRKRRASWRGPGFAHS